MIDWINGLTGDQWPLWVGWIGFLGLIYLGHEWNDRHKR